MGKHIEQRPSSPSTGSRNDQYALSFWGNERLQGDLTWSVHSFQNLCLALPKLFVVLPRSKYQAKLSGFFEAVAIVVEDFSPHLINHFTLSMGLHSKLEEPLELDIRIKTPFYSFFSSDGRRISLPPRSPSGVFGAEGIRSAVPIPRSPP